MSFIDEGADPVDESIFFDMSFDGVFEFWQALYVGYGGIDKFSSWRFFFEEGGVEVSVVYHHEGSGNGCGGKEEHIGIESFSEEGESLMDTESLLFVDDDEVEIFEEAFILEESVSSDGDECVSVLDIFEGIFLGFCGMISGEGIDWESEVFGEGGEVLGVLMDEGFCGGHEYGLESVLSCGDDGGESDDSFSAPDVAL